MTQSQRILQLLEERGEQGVLNIELNSICFRYGGRLFDLRCDGYRIKGPGLPLHALEEADGMNGITICCYCKKPRNFSLDLHGCPQSHEAMKRLDIFLDNITSLQLERKPNLVTK